MFHICFIYVIYTYVISRIKYILSVFFHPHKKRIHFHYNVYNNRNHVHSHHIYSQFQEGTMMTKGNLLKAISNASLWILCTAFLQKLYFARVSHGMVQFVLKMAHLSILMEPTLLLEKASATVSYNAFGWCWYLNVACMLAA